MRRIQWTILAALVLTGAALAQPRLVQGTVHAITPNGAVVGTPHGAYLIPVDTVTFQVGGINVQYSSLSVGTPVQFYLPQSTVLQPYPCQCPLCQGGHHYNGKGKGKGKGKGYDGDDD
ncbi:MAG: hypothetical protein AB1758_25030 [Candidatus Eremiobacterota bacterium]